MGQGPVSGYGDDGRESQEGVLQAGGQVGGAYRLGHAGGGAVGGPGVTVGHVGGGFLAVANDAFNTRDFQFRQNAAGNGRDVENVGHSVPLEGFRHEPGAGHSWHGWTSILFL